MPTEFISETVISPELAAAMMKLAPANPFCTRSYAEAMRASGSEPSLLGTERDGKLIAGCYGFIISGHLNRSLWIPSFPDVPGEDVFWDGLLRFCSVHRITYLELNSYASSGKPIPPLPGEVERHHRLEYVLDLEDREWEQKVARKHWQNIRRAQQTGVALYGTSDLDACREHLRLWRGSMERRHKRGESIIGNAEQELAFSILALEKGAGELFQAVVGGDVLSSGLILKAAEGAYYASAGTSPEGMKCGASHFLIYSIVQKLREESIRAFNLGDAESNPGLSLFKTRFGATPVALEHGTFYFGSEFRRKVSLVARSLRQAGSVLLRRMRGGSRSS